MPRRWPPGHWAAASASPASGDDWGLASHADGQGPQSERQAMILRLVGDVGGCGAVPPATSKPKAAR